MTPIETATSFELVVPPDPEMLRVVRLAASGMASFVDLDLSALEGLRVGADELVSTLIQAGAGPITISFAVLADCLSVSARTTLDGSATFEVDPLTDRMLDELVSRHTFVAEGSTLTGHIEISLPDA